MTLAITTTDAELQRQWVILNTDLDGDDDTVGAIYTSAMLAVDTLPAHTLVGLSVKVQALAVSLVDGDTPNLADLLRTTREALDRLLLGTVTHWPEMDG